MVEVELGLIRLQEVVEKKNFHCKWLKNLFSIIYL